MLIFDMIRHGEEDKNELLSKKGKQVVKSISFNITDYYDDFLTSPYERCQQTIKIFLGNRKKCSFEIIPWLCTRFPKDWNSIICSEKFRNQSRQFRNKFETFKNLAPDILLRDAKHTLFCIQRFAEERKYCGKILAISHNILIATVAGLFRTNTIFDPEFNDLPNLSGARIIIDKDHNESERLTLF